MTIVDKTAEPADVFAAHLARWEATEADPDGTVERVARAIYETDNPGVGVKYWDDETSGLREEYRANARAAIAALRPAPDAPRVDEGRTLAAPIDHADAVADTGNAYTVEHRRPWHLSCLWCEFETAGHRTKTDAMEAMSKHYADVTGISGWRVTS